MKAQQKINEAAIEAAVVRKLVDALPAAVHEAVHAFLEGVAPQAANEEMIKTDTESTPGTALVLASLHQREEDANNKWLEQAGTSLTTSKSRADNSLRAGAFYDGRDYGKTVSLNQQVGTSAHSLKRLK